jgi:hypothetical protein
MLLGGAALQRCDDGLVFKPALQILKNSGGARQLTSAAKAGTDGKTVYRSAKALRHPRASARSSYSAAC